MSTVDEVIAAGQSVEQCLGKALETARHASVLVKDRAADQKRMGMILHAHELRKLGEQYDRCTSTCWKANLDVLQHVAEVRTAGREQVDGDVIDLALRTFADAREAWQSQLRAIRTDLRSVEVELKYLEVTRRRNLEAVRTVHHELTSAIDDVTFATQDALAKARELQAGLSAAG